MEVKVLKLDRKQKEALDRFKKCYISENDDTEVLKECLHVGVDPKFIYEVVIYHKESKEFVEYANNFGWDELCKNIKLPEKFIRENIDKFKWDNLCTYQDLSESFIREFSDKINWALLFLRDIKFSPELLYDFQENIKNSIFTVMYNNAMK